MQKAQAQNLVIETLQNDFDKERFLYFVKNLFNKIDETKTFNYTGAYISEAFRPFVKSYERIGQYVDSENNKIDVLIVYLQKETSLERARTAQRNFVARYLKDRDQKEAGLIAFVSPDPADWRFSLVKMEYKFTEDKSGKTKVKEEFTPAKRWSFLVGKNENSHTAQSRLAPIVEDDQTNPTLKQLEDAFNIEKVTKEFFEKYRDLFLRTVDALKELVEKDEKLRKDFEEKSVIIADFTKKLLGQIVFLYFLQKKGWFGVEQGKEWGTGSKRFMRDLFEGKIIAYGNFFNDVLEHLFYDALARDRSDIDHFNPHFNCKIPFLNGGLFDPINGYSWEKTEINLPNDLFSNDYLTKEKDKGTGILDIFDRYNFTVKEDEPLEKEVAVDPEMLGKVFENLLEVKDRKSIGTYYTPREIVHYMCEQSLVNYLATELKDKVSKQDLEKFIKIGENVVELEAVSISKEDNPEYGGDYKRLLPDSIKEFVRQIDDKLATIKVCDPAIGSGAFPVGMMNVIVKARMVLSSYLKDKNRTLYTFKRDCIQNSLYGVDIDPGAVEIAKLRLWLSLVVDEDNIKQIKPLPNLDYKIMQGNSLLEEFEGIKLFDEKLLKPITNNKDQLQLLTEIQRKLQSRYIELHQTNKLTVMEKAKLDGEMKKVAGHIKNYQKESQTSNQAQQLQFVSTANEKAEQLRNLHSTFFEATQKSKKDEIKKQIEQLEWEFIEATLKEQGKTSALKKLEEFKRSNTKPFFLWKLNFADVFEEKGGFDVVIANPPYITYKGKQKINISKEDIKNLLNNYPNSAEYKINSYALFIDKATQIFNKNGLLSFIVPSTILQNEYLSTIREYLLNQYHINQIVNFGNKVFEAVTDSIILFVSNLENKDGQSLTTEVIRKDDLEFGKIEKTGYLQNEWLNNNGVINLKTNRKDDTLFKKIEEKSKPLSNYLEVNIGIKRANAPIQNSQETDYKKFLLGRDIGKYIINFDSKYILFDKRLFHTGVNENIFLEKEKILVRKTGNIMIAALDDKQFYTDQSIYNLYPKTTNELSLKYILGILNSRLMNFYFNKKMITNPDIFPYIKGIHLKLLPIREVEEQLQKPFIDLAEKIIKITKEEGYLQTSEKQAKVRDIEYQIDELVYKLYGLTEDEIKIVENS